MKMAKNNKNQFQNYGIDTSNQASDDGLDPPLKSAFSH